MNGVHDMGGMQGMGPIPYEKDEPVFHEPWEGRVFALNRSLGAFGKWNLDAARHQVEQLPAADYLRMSYYEKWAARMVEQLVKYNLATREEIESGKPSPASPKQTPPLTAEAALTAIRRGVPANRDVPAIAHFRAGQSVRARNINPAGPTRLPRYARGKSGTVERDRGVFVFPDTNGLFLGEKPQHLYSVRFSARELWGDQASPQDTVYIDVWDDYLEPA
jgi:nitrile hydratase subunit beta